MFLTNFSVTYIDDYIWWFSLVVSLNFLINKSDFWWKKFWNECATMKIHNTIAFSGNALHELIPFLGLYSIGL